MNTKRGRKNVKIEHGTFDLTRTDILNIEKIIKKRVNCADFYVEVGKEKWIGVIPYSDFTVSSVKYIKAPIKKQRYLRIISKAPNISVEFTPWRTTIVGQLAYSKGERMDSVKDATSEVALYLESRKDDRHRRFRILRRNIIRF